MAEEEKIVHHAKEAVHALANKEKKWKEKVKDFLLEILIIIIAVSITLWFHNWNDKKHEHEQEKEFLIGIRNDLKSDTANLNFCIHYMKEPMTYYDSVALQIRENKIDLKYIDKNQGKLLNNIRYSSNSARYESFKSSGNLRLIENSKLLTDISGLYSSSLPFEQNGENISFDKRIDDFKKYIGTICNMDSAGNYIISTRINEIPVKFYFNIYSDFLQEINRHRQELIDQIVPVIKEINIELKDRFDYVVPDKK